MKNSFPCYCCGKQTGSGKGHFVITSDGCNFMDFEKWEGFCKANGFDPLNPETAIGLCGCGWRPETFGPTCYRKIKRDSKVFKEIISENGEKYLFIS